MAPQTLEQEQAETISTAVVMAVADRTDRDPTAIGPLFKAIDPDALDRLFPVDSLEPTALDGRLTFRFEGCFVTVDANGWIEVQDNTDISDN